MASGTSRGSTIIRCSSDWIAWASSTFGGSVGLTGTSTTRGGGVALCPRRQPAKNTLVGCSGTKASCAACH
eukprot:157460-Prymnesium_polylepis.1